MDDLTAFVTARLDEDEAAAKTAAEFGMPWKALIIDGHPESVRIVTHVARHDPARVLRDVEAGRRVLERHQDCATMRGYCRDRHVGPPPCPDLADLLARWDDHPDYRQEWKP